MYMFAFVAIKMEEVSSCTCKWNKTGSVHIT